MRFEKHLTALHDKNRYRSLTLARGIDLSSNDYLGFRDHPFLKDAAIAAIENGISLGAGASRLLRGHTHAHESLEHAAETFFGCEKTLFFPNGFQANVALFQTLCSRRDVIIFDSLIHASARDGIQASHAKHVRVQHNNIQAYTDAIIKARDNGAQNIWIALESLYSMDGDFAPLRDIYALAQKYDAYLVVDEAHSTGVFGARGEGLCLSTLGLEHYPPNLITLHTCGKALGVAGGLICAGDDVIDYMINKARPFIYSTAPPPLQAHLVEKALDLSARTNGDAARKTLKAHINHVKLKCANNAYAHLNIAIHSHIIPIILGADKAAMMAANTLQNAGYDVRAIRPPTVPEGQARLRISLNAALDTETIDTVFNAITQF